MVQAVDRALRPAHVVGDLSGRQSNDVPQNHNLSLLRG
jgi:hypothetical protein